MTQDKSSIRNKRKRIDIRTLEDLKKALNIEGYKVENLENISCVEFKSIISSTINIKDSLAGQIYERIRKGCITYRADNIDDFIDYMKKLTEIQSMHKKLWDKIYKIDNLYIERTEYDRKHCKKDDVNHMITSIEYVRKNLCERIDEYGKIRLSKIGKKLDREYIYAKDIELLKKMITKEGKSITNTYESDTNNKTLYFDIPKELNSNYIKPKEGTVEYHDHITRNIPRIKRLIRNVDKYLKPVSNDNEKEIYIINQSSTLQDSINIAVANFNDREFKAISGSNDINGFCTAPIEQEAAFTSSKVNRLGTLGVGYKREFDSEKKIIENIHKLIKENEIKDNGKLIMYSIWEPCPSCCYAISQFCNAHPHIEFTLKYWKKYGEK